MKYCTNCGNALEEQVRFCPECGAEQPARQAETSGNSFTGSSASGGETSGGRYEANASAQQYTNGAAPNYNYNHAQAERTKTNGLGIAGFVVSLCAFPFVAFPPVGLVLALTGLGLSIASMAVAGQKNQKNGLGIAGFVLSLVFCLSSLYYLFEYFNL